MWAVRKMRDRNGNGVPVRTKEQVETILRSHGVDILNDKGYDAVFVFHMGVSDYLGSSMPDEASIAKYVRDLLDDSDGYDGIAFTRFLADCSAKGDPIDWEDMI